MRTLLRTTAVIGFLATAAVALAQQPPAGGRGGPGGGRGGAAAEPSLITYEMAATAMAAAEAFVRSSNLRPMTIRIVDQNNNVVMVHRMQDANPFTARVAEQKTLTVIGSKMTSAEYGAKLAAGEIEAIEGAVNFGGGVPVYKDGQLIGAIAASGGTPQEDENVSKAGVDAIGGSISMN